MTNYISDIFFVAFWYNLGEIFDWLRIGLFNVFFYSTTRDILCRKTWRQTYDFVQLCYHKTRITWNSSFLWTDPLNVTLLIVNFYSWLHVSLFLNFCHFTDKSHRFDSCCKFNAGILSVGLAVNVSLKNSDKILL